MKSEGSRLSAASITRFEPILGRGQIKELQDAASRAWQVLAGRRVWNVNSTGAGGGVAELLEVLLPYARGSGVDTRWMVLSGDAEFFAITKRLCNGLYGIPGDGGPLESREHSHYQSVSQENAATIIQHVRERDVVVLHDPQTAGLTATLRRKGATVVWRCHVGRDAPNAHVRRCWTFLRPYLEEANAYVFSTDKHVPHWVDRERTHIIAPSIDPFAAKNVELSPATVRRVLGAAGLVRTGERADTPEVNFQGSPIRIERAAQIIRSGEAPSADAPLVVQVSRWDRLKDMLGVMRSFAEYGTNSGAQLALVGPEVSGVADDPEAAAILEECRATWEDLPHHRRSRVQLVCLPMADLRENAIIVNAIQRHAAVVVQKSLAEGFGLTVTEAMWKARPIVASAVGGIPDQIAHKEHGLLLDDPTDLHGLADGVDRLLDDRTYAEDLGRSARERAIDRFLSNRHLVQYAELFENVLDS